MPKAVTGLPWRAGCAAVITPGCSARALSKPGRISRGDNARSKAAIGTSRLVIQPTGQRVADLMAYIAKYHAAAMLEMLAGKEV